MCGIAGAWDTTASTAGDELAARVSAMGQTLRHRGPDDAGTWVEAASGVAFAHQRLAILDLSHAGHQPMRSACGRYTLSFNGELYNFAALRRLLGGGRRWRGSSDTEVLLEAVSAWGVHDTLAQANGMFALAVWDSHEHELHLARDRVGEKPLFSAWHGRTLLFGSELKALRAYPDFRPDVSAGGLHAFLSYGYVPGPHTILEGVTKLVPGAVVTVGVSGSRIEQVTRRYWSYPAVADGARAGSVAEAVDELDALLRDAVALRLRADVPVGAFLSAGIDSTAVVAAAQARSSHPIRTFTVAMKGTELDESRGAAAIARHLGTDHTELQLRAADALDLIPHLPYLYDEPLADPSCLPTALMCRAASEHVKVVLSGDGGDEVFAGYNRYVLGDWAWRRFHRWPLPLRRALSRAMLGLPPQRWDSVVGRVVAALPSGLRVRAPGDKIHKLARALPARSVGELYHSIAAICPDASELLRARPTGPPIRPAAAPADSVLASFLLLDGLSALPDDMLVKVDRASMAVGLEARVPLLDHRVVELARRVPADQLVRDGQGKWLLRRVVSRSVPDALMAQPKTGFDPPLAAWLRGPLRGLVEDLLSRGAIERRGVLDAAVVRGHVDDHMAGRRNNDYLLWSLLVLALWWDAWVR